MEEDKLLTTAEVAKRFGVSERTITRHIQQNLLLAIRLTPRQWVIRESALPAYVENKRKLKKKATKSFQRK